LKIDQAAIGVEVDFEVFLKGRYDRYVGSAKHVGSPDLCRERISKEQYSKYAVRENGNL
jgi:hypothetical protein